MKNMYFRVILGVENIVNLKKKGENINKYRPL